MTRLSMRKRAITVIVVLMVAAGLSLLLYPTVSDYLNDLSHRQTISDYTASVEPLEDERYEGLLAAARAYNERLAEKGGFKLSLSEEELAEYNSLLDTDRTGVMGYVSVPKVDISLPIYHGTSDDVLQSGVGHLEGSSLPVGGPGTHAVLSGHTGLPSAKLFTNIDQLVVGDTFTVRILKETLIYEVDQILVVLPSEMDALRIQPGEDYCTLMTCTPYGINSHRLLVRGRRVPTPVQENETPPDITEEDPGPDDGRLFGLALVLIVAVLIAAALLTALLRRRRTKQRKEENENSSQRPPEP